MMSTRNSAANGAAQLKAIGSHMNLKEERSIHKLAVALSRAQTLRSLADEVRDYCLKAFRSPAGMIFVERDNDLQLVSQWPSKQIPKDNPAEEMIRKGPAARAFRRGQPVLWRQERMPDSKVSRFLCRLFKRPHWRAVSFIPISVSGHRPVGVLALVLPHPNGLSLAQEDLARVGELVSGWIVRARAYEDAVAARLKAENAIQIKDEFLSTLSHELRNPMMPILGWAVSLSSGTLPVEKQNLALDAIIRNIRTMNYLIDDLFDAARISSGKLRLQPSEVRIQNVAREALTAIQPMIETKKLCISTDIAESIPPFLADGRRLQQVLVNLLNNAVKFTPDGGSVEIKMRRRGDSVECSVSDTGKGIEPKFLPYVFDRFRQENRSSKVQTGGLGLGLAIVREIVSLHDGSIEAFSDGTDKGSTFVLRLPLRRKHVRSGLQPHDSNASHGKKIGGTPE